MTDEQFITVTEATPSKTSNKNQSDVNQTKNLLEVPSVEPDVEDSDEDEGGGWVSRLINFIIDIFPYFIGFYGYINLLHIRY